MLVDTQHFRDVYRQRPANAAAIHVGDWICTGLVINNKELKHITNVNEAMHHLLKHQLHTEDNLNLLSFFNRQLS